MKELERFIELEKLLERECDKYEDNCSTCPYQKECEEYEKLYQKNSRNAPIWSVSRGTASRL